MFRTRVEQAAKKKKGEMGDIKIFERLLAVDIDQYV
jgi:hypothetical protein